MNKKQIVFIFTIMLLVCLTRGISVGGNVDVNGDGVVNTADLEFVGRHLGRLGVHAADVNDDNVVNIADLMLVKNAIGTPGSGVGDMVLIPAGEFQMGSNHGDSDERPVHTVYVDAFYMDKYEVTNAEYAAFLNAKGKHGEAGVIWFDLADVDARISLNVRISLIGSTSTYLVDAGYENRPVVEVSWYGAMAYAKWAGKRLPTEAEWEKAARGGLSGLTYPWGNSIDSSKANYNGNVGDTTAVGKYSANGYGLYDMAGNVWEWCLDEYNVRFYGISPARDPLSGANSIQWLLDNYTSVRYSRVLRGGSWSYAALYVRVAYRYSLTPSYTFNYLGFRCARSVSP